ncbi:unnamed protein product [Rotaria sp. Silwood1]|nr:unnamed protein product [Rotaria sp. Silwood1]CAF1193094.1 unnamed protein product [Rotaria sp. Silwood1]
MSSATGKRYDWKILALGRGVGTATKAEEYLKSLGYKNITVYGNVENSKDGDEKIITLLQQTDWDAVSFGGGLTGYDDHFPREITTLHWFNRLVNLVHQYVPKAKLIFVHSPNSIVDGIHRVLDEHHE